MTANRLAVSETAADMAALMRLLGDPTRIRLLGLLVEGERNVSDLCGDVDVGQATVSHHLGLLRDAGLVTTRRAGKQVYYALSPRHIPDRDTEDGLHVFYGHVRMCLGCRKKTPTSRSPAASACT